MAISVTFLRDVEHGGSPSQPEKIVTQLVDFICAAQSSLHFAIYDFRLDSTLPARDLIVNAIKKRAEAGVDCKIAFDHGKARASGLGVDPAPTGTAQFLQQAFEGTRAQCKPITDRNPLHLEPRLMHDKYIIRDRAVIWTGSLNLTDDSWTFQDSNIVQLESTDLAQYYETDFEELWSTGDIDTSGRDDRGSLVVGTTPVQVAFAPGEGMTIDSEVVALLAGARRRIKIASMLIASRQVLAALRRAFVMNQVVEFDGVYDATQMEQTIQNWRAVPHNQDLIPMFQEVASHLAKKHSLPWTPTSKHNFMHAKVLVCDDAVFTGSFNLSHSATQNAENAVILHDAQLADQYSDYINQLIATYRDS